jgi:Ca2+-binding EF-hand superfamily protein
MLRRLAHVFLTAGTVTLNIVCLNLAPAHAQGPSEEIAPAGGESALSSSRLAQLVKKSLIPPKDYLLMRLDPKMTLDAYRRRMDSEFRAANGDAKDEISADDAVFLTQMAAANYRAMFIAQLLPADLNGDGVITEDEVRRWWTYRVYFGGAKPAAGKTLQETIDDKIREMMAFDTNHDGRITFAELQQKALSLPYPIGGLLVFQLLTIAPDEKTVLTRADFETAVEKLFRDVDADGDGVVSADELRNYRASHPSNSAH